MHLLSPLRAGLCRREADPDREALAGLARRLDLAAGGRDDVLDDREAESRAAARPRLVAAVEALEEARQVGRRDARPVVGDGEGAAGELDRARASLAGVADRVGEQVLE